MTQDTIQTIVSVAALGLSIWAIILSKKNDKQLKKQAGFDNKYIVLQVLQDFLIKPTEYLHTEKYLDRMNNARNLARTHIDMKGWIGT